MKVTRDHYLNYILKITPYLILAYAIQAYLYLKISPGPLAYEVLYFLAGGLIFIIISFASGIFEEEAHFHRNHMEIGHKLLRNKEEILYRDIRWVEIQPTRHAFSHLIVTLHDGRKFKLRNIDMAYEFKKVIEKKKY